MANTKKAIMKLQAFWDFAHITDDLSQGSPLLQSH
jgi:hypothetical protein